jgi:hypothetical protein
VFVICVVDAGTRMLLHRVTRELNPGLAAIAAARNASVILNLDKKREPKANPKGAERTDCPPPRRIISWPNPPPAMITPEMRR